jgi:hypothetical protein
MAKKNGRQGRIARPSVYVEFTIDYSEPRTMFEMTDGSSSLKVQP